MPFRQESLTGRISSINGFEVTPMRHFPDKIYDIFCRFIRFLTLCFTGLLLITGFFCICYADDMEGQQAKIMPDNLFLNILGSAILLGMIFLCCFLICRSENSESTLHKRKRLLLVLVLGHVLFLGGILILFGRTAPTADAWSVYDAAQRLAKGDTSVIHPTDSYLSYYPHQIGLVAFFECLIRLWNLIPTDLQAYHFIKCVYVILTCVTILYQYASVHLLWQNDLTDCIYLILAGTNLPLIMYSSFVYSEVPSFAALSIGMFYLLRILKTRHSSDESPRSILGRPLVFTSVSCNIFPAAVCIVSFALSVPLRKNSLIILIAIWMVTMLEGIRQRRGGLLIFTTLCVALSLSILPATQKIYELRAGNTLKSGVPAMTYFAMGMQESSRGNGWYNAFNFTTYQENKMNTELTVEISKQAIAERLAYFQKNPGYAASFYINKYLSQWADGTYASRQATFATMGERHSAIESIYTGTAAEFYIAYCNLYQLLLYLGCFAGSLTSLLNHRVPPLYAYIGMIGAFGGFLFHMIWEANSRYIFLYGLLLLPYAAQGISILGNMFFIRKSHKLTAE